MTDDPRNRLDDQVFLERTDPSGMLGMVEDARAQWETATAMARSAILPAEWRDIRQVVIAGMGGSAIAGDLAAAYLSRRWPVAVHVLRGYSLPAWIGTETLLVACSYSGNTEETVSTWRQSGAMGLMRAVVTTGGTIGAEAESEGVPLMRLPEGFPPRAALPSLLANLLTLLAAVGPESGTSPGGDVTLQEIEEVAGQLDRIRGRNAREVPVSDNPAKQLALWLETALPVLYAADYPLGSVALRWRGQISENAKRLTGGHTLPEMNHNEIVGYEAQADLYPACRAVFLEDPEQGSRIDLRIQTTVRILEQSGAPVRRIASEGEGLLARMLSLVALGDYTSVYLALGWEIDPTPVERIDYLKSILAEAAE
jgi:glucose/mannose-6-phosphate isomerase